MMVVLLPLWSLLDNKNLSRWRLSRCLVLTFMIWLFAVKDFTQTGVQESSRHFGLSSPTLLALSFFSLQLGHL